MIKITGVASHARGMKAMRGADAKRVEQVVRECTHATHVKSDYYCPKDTLALVKSGEEIIEGSGMRTKGRVEYGGESAPYAIYVHEDMEAHHDAPTCAKFLEIADRECASERSAIIKKVFGG